MNAYAAAGIVIAVSVAGAVGAATATATATAYADELALIVYYNERPPAHYTGRQGTPAGPAVEKVIGALKAAHISYALRALPAKRQLVILRANQERACMMSWIALAGRERAGKLSDVIYEEPPRGDQRRLWCTMAVPDEVLKRFNAALAKP